MIIFILTLVIAIIGFIVVCLTNFDNDLLQILGDVFFAGGVIAAFIMMTMIIIAHVGVSAAITQNQIEYKSLCERQEIVESEYEDVSKSDVIKDIAEWNKSVYSYKHWAYNPWTNWFYSKKVADNMEMIE